MPGNCIYQCATEVTTAWVHNHSCRFVNDHQIVVFINDIKWNILWFDGCIIMRTVEHQCDHIAWTNFVVTFNRTIIHMDKTCIGSLLDTITTRMRLMLGNILINTYGDLPFVHFHTEMFIKLSVTVLFGTITISHQFQFIVFQKLHHSTISSNSSTLLSSISLYSGSIYSISPSVSYCPFPIISVSGASIETLSPVETLRPRQRIP